MKQSIVLFLDFYTYLCRMIRQLLTVLGSVLAACPMQAQSFNTITDGSPRYKVAAVQDASEYGEMEILGMPKEASLDGDVHVMQADTLAGTVCSATHGTDTALLATSGLQEQQTERTRYPLSVSYPLRQSKLVVTSPYGMRRHPILGGVNKMHNGVDLRAKCEPVYSMLPGTVAKVGYDNVSGNYITLQHASMRVSYCHLSVIAVEEGTTVYAGQPIGIAGNTGRSTGVHLHLTLKVNGQYANPMLLLRLIEECLAKEHG